MKRLALGCIVCGIFLAPAAIRAQDNKISAPQEDYSLHSREFHVAKYGSDANPGTEHEPFLTIQQAASMAEPGNVITVHEGVYRERVDPPRGGVSPEKPIVYRAAPGEKVEIKGSEIIKSWEKVKEGVWKVCLPNSFFGNFNPYSDTIHGPWFESKGLTHHTGAVYLKGHWMVEASKLQELMQTAAGELLWFGEVDGENTTIWAQFPECDPNEEKVEINVRQTVFFPEKQGVDFISVRGFHMSQAATPWAPPTVEQIGLIGPHWSKGWVIEDNTISHSTCVGICLGLGDVGISVVGTGIGFTKMANYLIEGDLWSKEEIGGHVVRNNRISHCEQAGIVGSFGAPFCLIEGNHISDIHVREQFTGMEQGGIKLHAAVDVVVRNNCVYNTGTRARGIWLDWMGQGAIVSGNLVFNTGAPGLYLEVNHGPILVANNILLSETALSNRSRGTAYVHNYFGGQCVIGNTTRITPFMEPHSTALAGMHDNYNGDDRFYNNIFAAPATDGKSVLNEEERRPGKPGRLANYDDESMPLFMGGNLYLNGAIPHENDANPLVFKKTLPEIKAIRKADGLYMQWPSNLKLNRKHTRKLITTEMLGRALVPDMRYEHVDGSPIRIDTDYSGNERKLSNPFPGPFTEQGEGEKYIKVWPKGESKSPNVLLILTDDLGFGDVSFLNKDSKIRTPRLDELAREGIWFTDAHSPSTICSPTRYAILTGRYAWRGILKAGIVKPWDDPVIEKGRLTLGGMLKEKGYTSACIGKWHLGFYWPWKDGVKPPRNIIMDKGTSIASLDMFDFSHSIHGGPLASGFDSYFGDDVPNFPPYAFIENEHLTCTPIEMDPDDLKSIGQRGYLHGKGPGQADWKLDQVMPTITSRAVEYVHSQKESEKPFFLYFATTSPHTPVVPTEEFQNKSRAGYYGDYVLQTDDAIGRIVEALKQSGQFDNTLIIVTSDNGPEGFTYDLINEYSHYSMGQLRGIKRDTWEGGHRVPLVISWPEGKLPGGSRSSLFSLTDIFATIAAIIDYDLPEDRAEDSFNMLTVLKGGGSPRESMIYHNGKGPLALRDGNWVYIRESGAGRPEPEWFRQKHGVVRHDEANELFNLKDDPGEKINLYKQYPEKAAQMEMILQKMIEAGGTREPEL